MVRKPALSEVVRSWQGVVASVAIAFMVLIPMALPGQETRGTILGRITDPTGALIPAVSVKATNTATGVTVTTRSNEAGNYVLPYLLTGTYTVQSEVSGFKKSVREGIQLRIGDAVEINIQMQLGNVAESVEVKGETPLLDTAASSLGQVIDRRRVVDLPSMGGNPMVLVLLAPGATYLTDMAMTKSGSYSIGTSSNFATDGGGKYNNEFTLDGISNTQAEKGSPRVGFIPPQSAVSELKVQTASFDASVGHTIGALVNVSTKSGTNQLHGEAHWWVKNSALDAPNLFQNRSGQKPAVYQDNRWGISAGGPVEIPKLYHGKNRTFWFYAYEGNKFGVPATFLSTVPTDAMRKGDLSGLLALGSNYQVYDPTTTVAAAGGRFQRQPFPNNLIPASRLDPVALKILPYWPTPNQTGTKEGLNNYFSNAPQLENTWDHLGRADHTFTENHRAFISMHSSYWHEYKDRAFPDNPTTGYVHYRHNEGVSVDDVYVFSPRFLLNVRYGLLFGDYLEQRPSRGFDLASLGFPPQLVGTIDRNLATFPNVQVGSLTALGSWSDGDGGTSTMTHALGATFTHLRSNHNLRFGADFRVYRQNLNRFPLDVSPQLIFSSTYTRGPADNSAAPAVGGELAAFLLGIPGGEMDHTASYAQQDKYFGIFLQDDIKLSPRLTLNLGLRYEYEVPVTERFNRSVAHFAFDQPSPIAAQAQANYAANPIPELPSNQFKVLGGLTFAGVNGNPRSYWQPDKRDFLPRVGLAYQVFRKTTVRAGYGIFFDSVGVSKTAGLQTGFSQSTPIQASLNNGLTYVATTANPLPNGLLAPVGAAAGLATNLGQALTFYPTVRPRPYVQRWSAGVQRELPGQVLLEASYVGNRGTHLGVTRQLNNTPAQYLSQLPVRDAQTINFLSQQFPNPFFGINSIYGTTMTRANLLKPYPQFGNVAVEQPVGYTWYHSLQTRVEKRFSRGYTFQLAYTWSKLMQATEFLNVTDPVPYRSISDLDRTQRLVVSGIWELPFGQGRRFGRKLPAPVEFLAGGWQLNGVMQHQSGPPLAFGDVWTLFTGSPNNVVLPRDQRSVDRWFNTDAGFNRNSAQQLASDIRVSPLRFSGVRADGQARWDFSAIKHFRVTEKGTMDFRAECLNAWNHPNLLTPNTTPTSSAFGTITGQDVPRTWQMSLKLGF
jgi:Carboxypeptidase regulatory-like domain/TonB dependent receptor